ncbi:AAA family ATPase [Knoellia sp. CPCC 206453]|uniref:AAA family ATPase n=1 Tax=Knoellia pratensis TaxID=3404796 RepID=UPI00360C3DBD
MTNSASSAPTLSAALASLLEVAMAAGVPEPDARAEAEALAATVAEAATGAWVDWVAQTGGDRSAEDFAAAASRGRRWRSTPTPTLARLAAERSPEAPAYAKALALVCTAGAGLGTPTTRTIGNASQAAAAQLGAFQPTPTPPPPAASDPVVPEATSPGPTDEFTRGVRSLWGDVMGQLDTLRTRTEEVRRGPSLGGDRAGSPFDLDPQADPWGPGAFPDLTSPRPSQPSEPSRTSEPSGPHDTATAGEPPEQPAPEQVKPEEPQKSVEELLAELDALTGLAGVKGEIHRQVAVLRIEAKRAAAGLKTPDLTRHLVFTGNPGTGKTTVARLVSGIYRALGLLSKGQLVEVDRSELVAGYLGQTAMKTQEVVKSAIGGVLFIDEAYSLAGDQYGTEAVDTLVKEMEDQRDDLVIIVAGYPVPMQFFIAQNPGLASRFRTTIDFVDYTDDELVAIFRGIATGADYDVTDAVEARFRELLAQQARDASFGNGRYARNVFEAAVGHQAWRLREIDEPTVEQLRSLEPEDLSDGPAPVPADMLQTEPEPTGEEAS